MGKRIFTALIWLPVAVLLIAYAPMWGLALAIAALSAVGAYELLWATGLVRQRRLCAYSSLFAALTPFWVYFGSNPRVGLAGLFLFVFVCFIDGLIHPKTVTFQMISGSLFGALVVPCFLSAFLRMEQEAQTRLILVIPLLYPFFSDIGGYFVGRFLGKHKLAPELSPKKTVEGSVGAIAFAVIGGLLFGLVAEYCFNTRLDYLILALLGIPVSIISQCGDLVFSYIKREAEIKDYGEIFLGHGGVLDRFDSVIFAAPALEVLLWFIPLF